MARSTKTTTTAGLQKQLTVVRKIDGLDASDRGAKQPTDEKRQFVITHEEGR